MAVMVPRWLEPGPDQCPSINCFSSSVSPYLVLSIGLGVGIVLNVFFTRWTRGGNSQTAGDS
jgi:hypothetical protein